MMIFKNSIKIVGCRDTNIVYEALIILFEDYLSKVYPLTDEQKKLYIKKDMKNEQFVLGIKIDRQLLNEIFLSVGYANYVYSSVYESECTSQVTTYFHQQEMNRCTMLFIGNDKKWFTTHVSFPAEFAKNKTTKNKQKHISLTFHCEGHVKISGKNSCSKEDAYNFAIYTILCNRRDIEERLEN